MNKYLKYGQGEIKINTSGQKMYEITDDVNAWIKKEEISGGQLTIFIKHTSASLCIQENASKDVLEDIDNFLKKEFLSLLEIPRKDVQVFKAPAQGLILEKINYA